MFKQSYKILDENAFKYIKQYYWEVSKIEEIKQKLQNAEKIQQKVQENQEYEY